MTFWFSVVTLLDFGVGGLGGVVLGGLCTQRSDFNGVAVSTISETHFKAFQILALWRCWCSKFCFASNLMPIKGPNFPKNCMIMRTFRPRVAFKILLCISATAPPFLMSLIFGTLYCSLVQVGSSHPVAPTKTSPAPSLIRWEFVTARKRSFRRLCF